MKLVTQSGRFAPPPSIQLGVEALEPELFGTWHPEDQTVILNRALLDDDDPQAALGTLVHEIRHALQDAVINGRLEHPHELEAETEIWRRANEDYDPDDFMAYLYNPLETDARGAEQGALIGFWKGSYALARSGQPRPE